MVLQETSDRPAVMLGTSSDRIGTPDGQAYFLTVAKDIERWVGLPVAPTPVCPTCSGWGGLGPRVSWLLRLG